MSWGGREVLWIIPWIGFATADEGKVPAPEPVPVPDAIPDAHVPVFKKKKSLNIPNFSPIPKDSVVKYARKK